MNVKQLFYKPLDRAINGVVKADQNDDVTVYQELDEYVVTKELEKHFRDFFQSYGTDLSDPSIANRVGVWISGFFGSGKSHFLKTLSYILANKVARDAAGNERTAAEFFDENKIHDAFIRADIDKAVSHKTDVLLFNIDSKSDPNDSDKILNVFLRVFNEYQGFSAGYPHIAHLERHLDQIGLYEKFKQSFQDACGSEWEKKRKVYRFSQRYIEQALSETLGISTEEANKWFEESQKNFSVSIESFCQWVKEYLDAKGPQHRIVFLVDEVGQFIGNDTQLMLRLQTITENLGTICKGRAWIIVTSQADMDAVLGEMSSSKANDFSKITGRFKTRLSLSSSNTDEVIQKRLLRKTPEAEQALHEVFAQKGDILKNQLSFDRSGPTLKNFDGPQSFVDNYPFVPYHFQLVQKVFEQIRKVGATGAHLAYGERSMLDAFQMAANAVATEEIGVLVPFHLFYRAVEGFLDPAVKRTIDNATSNTSLDQFDVEILRTLFLIRYVELIKGTLDNLVTLSIEKIDEDKLVLRQRIEASLQRLEKESLITRNGDEFLFLTNEERDITKKIKATDLSSSEENQELAKMLFKELLRDNNKFRYSKNKVDYNLGRYLDGYCLDSRAENALKVEIISPLDVNYKLYTDAKCITYSAEGAGQVLFKLGDDLQFFNELRTSLRTEKYNKINNDGSQPDIAKILSERMRENNERKKRLRARLEQMLLEADCYVLGRLQQLKSTGVAARVDEACAYLLENTYTKLDYLQNYQENPLRELKAVLSSDDIAQIGMKLDGSQPNAKAMQEIEQYISLRATGTPRIYVYEILDHFMKLPFGWPENEILLILAQIAVSGRITFEQGTGTSMPNKDVFEALTNSRRLREISVSKKQQVDDRVLKQARELAKDLFTNLGPATEKELYQFYLEHFGNWLSQLKQYKSKTDLGTYPGKKTIEDSIFSLERLLKAKDSFQFFKDLIQDEDLYLDLEANYRDLHEFYSNQIHVWQQLQQALLKFEKNKSYLAQDQAAHHAMTQLYEISKSDTPYSRLNQVSGLIGQVDAVNERILQDKRSEAISSIDLKIAQLSHTIQDSGIATSELSNRLLRPLQQLKQEIESESSVGNIYALQSQRAGVLLDEAVAELEVEVIAEKRRREQAKVTPNPEPQPQGGDGDVIVKPVVPSKVEVKVKPVVELNVGSVYEKVSKNIYLETEEDVTRFIQALEQALKAHVSAEKRIRLR